MQLMNIKPRDLIIVSHPNGESEAWFVSKLNFHFYLISATNGAFHETLSEMKIDTLDELQNVVSAYFLAHKTQVIHDGRARITITLT